MGTVAKLPRIPDDVDDLKTMCFDTWSRLYQNDPPVPDRIQPEKLVIAYGSATCRRSKQDVAANVDAPPPSTHVGTTKRATATRSQIQSLEGMQTLQDIVPAVGLFIQQLKQLTTSVPGLTILRDKPSLVADEGMPAIADKPTVHSTALVPVSEPAPAVSPPALADLPDAISHHGKRSLRWWPKSQRK